jgi:hypothetical protein
MFGRTWNNMRHHGRRVLGHAVPFAGHVDRALGTAAHYYKHLAPVIAPIAREHGYGELMDRIHNAVVTIHRAREHGRAVGNAIREAREVK